MKALIWDLWRRDRKAFLSIVGMQLVSSCMGGVGIVMLIPLLEWFSAGAASQETGVLLGILGVYVALIVCKAYLNRRLTIAQTSFLEGYTFDLRRELYDAVGSADWQQLASFRQADLIGLFTTQCSQISSGVSCLIRLMTSLVSAAMQIAIACWMSVPVTVTVLACGAGMLAAFLPLRQKAREYGNEMIAIGRDFYGELFHQLNAIKEIRTYGVEESHRQRFDGCSRSFWETQVAYARVHTLPGSVSSVAAGMVLAVVAALSLVVWRLDMTRMVILVLIFSRLWPLFSSWQTMIQTIQTNLPALQKLRQTMEAFRASTVEPAGEGEIAFSGTVTFSHVRFRYPGSEEQVLEDVNFSLSIGSITALVGRSGAGKSTTADLLMGFLTPEGGEIRIDDSPLTPEMARAWRKHIGYIPQAPMLLNASVRENLSRFHPNATQEEMILALKQAAAWAFVEKLPQGLDTVLGDRGVRLSGGERQRIVLARVLLGHPKLIVLDEATSALDYESEGAVRDVLDALRNQTAILVIAHRLATVRIADNILVLENGKITERGPFSDLIQNPDGYLTGMMHMG